MLWLILGIIAGIGIGLLIACVVMNISNGKVNKNGKSRK